MAIPILFDEILFDSNLLNDLSLEGSPSYANTNISNPGTGINKVNVVRQDFQHKWSCSLKMLDPDQLNYFNNFWAGGYGSGYGFRVQIITDFYVEDQLLGIGDGVKTQFPLIKTYKRPGANHQYDRRIIKPVVAAQLGGTSVTLYEADGVTPRVIPSLTALGFGIPAFKIKLNTTVTTAYTIDNTIGMLTMTAAPGVGVAVYWSGEFDTPVQFMNNDFRQRPEINTVSEVSGFSLVEILPAQLRIFV